MIAGNVFHRAVALGELGPVIEPGEAVFSLNGEERARVTEFEPPARDARVRRSLPRASSARSCGPASS